MNIFITLDYELFFGQNVGSVEGCIIRPTEELLSLLNHFGVKATFFADIGYLVRCEELGVDKRENEKLKKHIGRLHEEGHEIALHTHPHWQKAEKKNQLWSFNYDYYKFSNYSKGEAEEIIKKYARGLAEITGKPPVAFRAGGWSIQPFAHIADALYQAGIRVDSTVFPGGYTDTPIQSFDFRNAPVKAAWTFDDDPLEEDPTGRFFELPISSIQLSPTFFWKLAVTKKLGGQRHKSYGDGNPVATKRIHLLKLLTKPSYSVASIDGFKASLLPKYRKRQAIKCGESANLVLMGHPKALTPFSLEKLRAFLTQTVKQDQYLTISQWLYEIQRQGNNS